LKRVHALVEGQTEETFLRQVLAPHLSDFGVALNPVIVATKRIKTGLKFRGGVTGYGKVRRDLLHLLGDSSAAVVTTMFDLYGLPEDFPPSAGISSKISGLKRALELEAALRQDLSNPRILPYFSVHEFEALLLASPEELETVFPNAPFAHHLKEVLAAVATPEEVNDGVGTHPSARILHHVPSYRKALHGPIIAKRVGLATIRRRCPHFHQWVGTLESIGTAPSYGLAR